MSKLECAGLDLIIKTAKKDLKIVSAVKMKPFICLLLVYIVFILVLCVYIQLFQMNLWQIGLATNCKVLFITELMATRLLYMIEV